MVQTVRSVTIPAGHKLCAIEKPHVLSRIFFCVCAFAPETTWYESQITLGDPTFSSSYALGGPVNYFESKGEGIFQGDIWICNLSNINILYSVSEILH